MNKYIVFATLFLSVNARYLTNYRRPQAFINTGSILEDDLEDYLSEKRIESRAPGYLRPRRQIQAQSSVNKEDNSNNYALKIPLGDQEAANKLTAFAAVDKLKGDGSYNSATGQLTLERDRNAFSVTGQHHPYKADQLTGAAKVNLLHTDNHNLDGNAHITRTFPKDPVIPDFNSYGGGVDYTYKGRHGASLGVSHNDFSRATDYSALGKLNLYHDKNTDFNFKAGAHMMSSPFIPRSSWEPTFLFSLNKSF